MKVQGLCVDDDLAPTRSEDPDERTHRGNVKRPVGTATDDVHLILSDPIDVLDDTQFRAVHATNGRADHLMPVDLAAAQFGVGSELRFQIGPADGVRGLA